MKLKDHGDGFCIWINARESYEWAHRTGAAWPCSTLSGHRVFAAFDRNGLVDLTVDGKDSSDRWDGHEFNALVADMAGGKLTPDHPCYFVAVSQFRS